MSFGSPQGTEETSFPEADQTMASACRRGEIKGKVSVGISRAGTKRLVWSIWLKFCLSIEFPPALQMSSMTWYQQGVHDDSFQVNQLYFLMLSGGICFAANLPVGRFGV